MSPQVTLNELIQQLRSEISSNISDSTYPVFFIESAEIEVMLDISKTIEGELKVGVLDILNVGGNIGKMSGTFHSMKLKLVPIIPLEEFRESLMKDSRLREKILDVSRRSLHKGLDEFYAGLSKE